MSVEKVYIFFTATDTLVSKLIRFVTKGQWSHVGIGFKDKDGSEFYYEALAGKGFRGGKAMSDLVSWQSEKPKSRSVAILDIPALRDGGDQFLGMAMAYSNTVTYGEMQLLAHFFVAKLGMSLKNTPNKVICSEIVSRIVYPTLNLMDEVHHNHDMVTPQSLFDKLIETTPYSYRYLSGKLYKGN